MFSSASAKTSQEEKQAFLDKSAKSNSREMSNEQSKMSKSRKDTSMSMSRSANTSRRGITVKEEPRKWPKMSDGTEFDTGPYGWIFSLLFIVTIWSIVIAFSVCLVYYQITRLDSKFPTYFGEGSFIGATPLVTFDPNPKRFVETRKNLMQFNVYDFDSYVNYLIRYKKLMKNYNNENKELCNKQKLTNDESCRFDTITGFGDCAFIRENLEQGLGFSQGQPCIMIKLNKIIGWYPSFLNSECPADNLCCGEGIKFECKTDDNLIIDMYPKQGIQSCYFPYANQPGYEQPFVMARLRNITIDKEVSIECRPINPELQNINVEQKNEFKFILSMSKKSRDSESEE